MSDTFWSCDYCDSDFDTVQECDFHEETCAVRRRNRVLYGFMLPVALAVLIFAAWDYITWEERAQSWLEVPPNARCHTTNDGTGWVCLY